MSEPAVQKWKKLRSQFEDLANKGDLSAFFSHTENSDNEWALQDGDSEVISRFDTIATETALLLGRSSKKDPCHEWLDALLSAIRDWEKDPSHGHKHPGISFPGEGIRWIGRGRAKPRRGDNDPNYQRHYSGLIEHAAQASVILCDKIIKKEVQISEREETIARSTKPKRKTSKPNKDQQLIIDVMKEGYTGLAFCEELDQREMPPRKTWLGQDRFPWPGSYKAAWNTKGKAKTYWHNKIGIYKSNMKQQFPEEFRVTKKVTNSLK